MNEIDIRRLDITLLLVFERSQKGNRPRSSQRDARSIRADQRRLGEMIMAFGYRYTLERQKNGWWLVRFRGIPEALTEGETEQEARANARDCVIAALEGYMKAGRPLPREGAGHSGADRAVLPSLVTAKLAVYETMRGRRWSKVRLAKELGTSENAVRRLLDLDHSSHMWIIDEALAKMNAELSIDLPKQPKGGKAA
jgi:antitoxin HicB